MKGVAEVYYRLYTSNKTFASLPVTECRGLAGMCVVDMFVFVMHIVYFHYYITGTLMIEIIINYSNRGQRSKSKLISFGVITFPYIDWLNLFYESNVLKARLPSSSSSIHMFTVCHSL